MTEEEHLRLAEWHRRKQHFQERKKWIWLSLWSLAMSLPVPLGPFVGIWWIGHCSSKISGLNAALSGAPRDIWATCLIFLPLLVMNVFLALGILFAACAVILR